MPKFKIMQSLVDKVNLVSREILTGLSVIGAFGREKEEEKRFDEANRELTRTQLFTNRVMTFMMPGMSMIMYCITLGIVWVAAGRIDKGFYAGRYHDCVYYICHDDCYVIPHAFSHVHHASESWCCGRAYR